MLEVVIERGMKEGEDISFARASEQAPDTIPGDVIVSLRTQQHHRFKRQGNDLHMEQHISLREALLGYSAHFAHMDGHRVNIVQEGVTPPEFVKIIKNEGMPQHGFPSEKGDLYIKFHIKFPTNLTPQQQEGESPMDAHRHTYAATHSAARILTYSRSYRCCDAYVCVCSHSRSVPGRGQVKRERQAS